MKAFLNSGEMCVVSVDDPNREEGFRMVDLGNYFISPEGRKVLITSREKAERYGHLLDVEIYINKETK